MEKEQRVIKFRAWSKVEQMMIVSPAWPASDAWHMFWGAAHNCSIMQFTGMKDVKGVEIYGGDIVQFVLEKRKAGDTKRESEVIPWEVYFDERGQWRMRSARSESHPALFSMCDRHEIIGNIYSNPELLTTLMS